METGFYDTQHRKAAILKDAFVKMIVQNRQLFLERCVKIFALLIVVRGLTKRSLIWDTEI